MCAAAISFARIRRALLRRGGSKGRRRRHGARFFSQPTCHHAPEVYGGHLGTGSGRTSCRLLRSAALRHSAEALPLHLFKPADLRVEFLRRIEVEPDDAGENGKRCCAAEQRPQDRRVGAGGVTGRKPARCRAGTERRTRAATISGRPTGAAVAPGETAAGQPPRAPASPAARGDGSVPRRRWRLSAMRTSPDRDSQPERPGPGVPGNRSSALSEEDDDDDGARHALDGVAASDPRVEGADMRFQLLRVEGRHLFQRVPVVNPFRMATSCGRFPSFLAAARRSRSFCRSDLPSWSVGAVDAGTLRSAGGSLRNLRPL